MSTDAGRRLLLIKWVHTLVWVMFVSIIFFVLWSGVTGNITIYSWIAVAAVLAEGLTLAIFKGSCPLTKIARKYSDSEQANFDIFLPEWLAKYNKQLFTTIYCIGLILMLYRHFVC